MSAKADDFLSVVSVLGASEARMEYWARELARMEAGRSAWLQKRGHVPALDASPYDGDIATTRDCLERETAKRDGFTLQAAHALALHTDQRHLAGLIRDLARRVGHTWPEN